MSTSKITVARLVTVFSGLLLSLNVLAQATVRDSSPVTTANTPAPSVSSNLAYQVQQLQQEVLELRGLLEEQAFQLKRLKQQRLDDYLDLDKRVSELSNNSGQSGAPASSGTISNTGGTNILPTASANSDAEKKLYRKGIDQLLSQQDYKGAQASFDEYLRKYPKGTYEPNVFYWQGQIFLSEGNSADAEKSFSTLLENYSNHQKAPDAKYKLAKIYFDQGKKTEAKALLEEVASSNTDVARLAKSFLSNQF
jgi:tol-pal system protein YbgF